MFRNVKAILLDKLLQIRSRMLYDQVLEYPSDDLQKVEKKDGRGGHFDMLMALAVGLFKASAISTPKKDAISDARVAQIAADCFEETTHNR